MENKLEVIDSIMDDLDSLEANNQGLIDGKKEERIRIATNMFKNNVDIETIIKCTGVSDEELKTAENNVFGPGF